MGWDDVLVLGGDDVRSLLAGADATVVELVRQVYLTHRAGETVVPHSAFVSLPPEGRERAIALAAFLGGAFRALGMKWIASFPGNPRRAIERASAIVVLNSLETGRPLALLEGSDISVKRTAASAALAATTLDRSSLAGTVGVIGCGPVNLETLRFLLLVAPELREVVAFDADAERAKRFAEAWRRLGAVPPISVERDADAVLDAADACSIATSAVEPHIASLGSHPPRLILHLSLRDLAPGVLLGCRNVVDDVDHALRAETSLHRAERAVGSRDFLWCTLGDLLASPRAVLAGRGATVVFSPFGLGILDVAVAQLVYQRALERGVGRVVPAFFPRGFA